MKRLCIAVGAWGLAVGIAAASGVPVAPAPSTPATPTAIQVLVDQLGADLYADREAAVAALEKIGRPAVDALKAAAKNDNPEVRTRAASLAAKIQREAENGTYLAAKRVKLEYKNIPLGTAINDLRNRSGLNVTLDGARVANPLRPITCETAELPVWEALDAFCTAAGLRESFQVDLELPKQTNRGRAYAVQLPPLPNADAIPVVLIDGTSPKLVGDRKSPVRVLALPPTFAGHKVTLGSGEVSFCLDVTPLPGLRWQEVSGVRIVRVIDSAGRAGRAGLEKSAPSMNEWNSDGGMFFAQAGAGVVMRMDMNGVWIPPETVPNPRVVPVPLRLATASATSLKRLEGSVFGEIELSNQTLISVADPLKKVSVRNDGPNDLHLTVLELKDTSLGGAMSFHVKIESTSQLMSQWMVNPRKRNWNGGQGNPGRTAPETNRLEAFDAEGKIIAYNAITSESSDDGMTSVLTQWLTFRKGGVPAKLVLVGPKSVTVEVPFALDNVPLP